MQRLLNYISNSDLDELRPVIQDYNADVDLIINHLENNSYFYKDKHTRYIAKVLFTKIVSNEFKKVVYSNVEAPTRPENSESGIFYHENRLSALHRASFQFWFVYCEVIEEVFKNRYFLEDEIKEMYKDIENYMTSYNGDRWTNALWTYMINHKYIKKYAPNDTLIKIIEKAKAEYKAVEKYDTDYYMTDNDKSDIIGKINKNIQLNQFNKNQYQEIRSKIEQENHKADELKMLDEKKAQIDRLFNLYNK